MGTFTSGVNLLKIINWFIGGGGGIHLIHEYLSQNTDGFLSVFQFIYLQKYFLLEFVNNLQ